MALDVDTKEFELSRWTFLCDFSLRCYESRLHSFPPCNMTLTLISKLCEKIFELAHKDLACASRCLKLTLASGVFKR